MIEILRLDHQGRGIGKIDNKIIFIPNTLPGEIIEYNITKSKKKYLEGEITKFIKKSSQRIEPICPYYNKCGGCQLMHLNYQNQLKYKQEKIENIIHKYVNENIKIESIIKADNIYNYRNKITLHSKNKIGMYKKDSNTIINIDSCLIANNKINEIIKELNKINIYEDEIIIRNNGQDSLLKYQNEQNNFNKINVDSIILNNQNIKGKGYNIETIENLKFIISPTSFFQVNTEQTIKLYNLIKNLANCNKSDNILDLYCGTGTIGLFINNNSKNILGIEINKDAIKDANQNIILNHIQNAKFINDDAKNYINKINYQPDIIIVDPPRSGLFKGMIEKLIKFKAKKIIYVSCDPITLSRDLKELTNRYQIEKIYPIDMFPNTYHVESVCLLTLK